MLQRIQTVYLILTEIVYILLFFIPILGRSPGQTGKISGMYLLDIPVLLGAAFAVTALAVATITQFRKRPLQIKLCNLGIALSLLVFGAVAAFPAFFSGESSAVKADFHTSYGIGIWLLPIPAVLFFLAGRAVKRDEELVRSADRLR